MQHYYYNTTDDDIDDIVNNEVVNDSDEYEEDEYQYHYEEDDEKEETKQPQKRCSSSFSLSKVLLDPRGKWAEEWNRVFLLVCAMGLFVDPLFFYAISISDTCMCLFIDGWFLVTVTVIRCMTDMLHLWNIWLQFYIHKHKRSSFGFIHHGTLSSNSFKVNKAFFFNIFILLPLPQVIIYGNLRFKGTYMLAFVIIYYIVIPLLFYFSFSSSLVVIVHLRM
ncbi:hypothetical protein MtrunA17_Chr2g0318551 [Medicago truncatula]|uniref:Transmembrane protein n=1 Tax=Medicago truncatula TaxID=3880 RepID=A0A396JJF8_MEDTR|nr:hypothetical protein MtrunA17_Chr2g0318551 [Medicago truncatula]